MDLPAPERPIKPTFSPGLIVRLKSVNNGLSASYAKLICSNLISPCCTTRSVALGLSTIVCGLESVCIPSFTVPIFSNRRAASHIIQRERLFTLKAIAIAVAIAPTPALPLLHNHNPNSPVLSVNRILVK